MDDVRLLPTRDGYDLWAEVYDGDGNPLVLLEEPHVERLLGDLRGRLVLDVGCGTGRHAVRIAQAGGHVTAVDFSHGMLAKAKAKPGASAVMFVEHDISRRLPFEDGAFERVLSCLMLDHVFDLPAFFAELRRLVRPDGFVVASVMHPALLLRGVQARFHDPATGQKVQPESAPHLISDYVMAAVGSGLRLCELSEHSVDAELVSRTVRAERYLGWPMLLLMKLEP